MTSLRYRKLSSWFPHIKFPLIIAAPMRTISSPNLVSVVNAAGGLGFLGLGYDLPSPVDGNHAIGLILYRHDPSAIPAALSALSTQPSAIWLHAFEPAHLSVLSSHLAAHSLNIPIFAQVASVAEGRAALSAGAHVLVAQGIPDAGGHGRDKGASIVALIPELRDAVGGDVPIIAAGGIADGHGVAAALTLGADGAAMGTRFIACYESWGHSSHQDMVLGSSDGGVGTERGRSWDECRGTGDWPEGWGGRGLINETSKEWNSGDREGAKARYKEAELKEDWTRLTMFAGTAVGLVKKLGHAGEIVVDVRKEAKRVLREVAEVYAEEEE